jgi:hypothetical protein
MRSNSGKKFYVQDKIQLQFNQKTVEAGTIDVYRGCPGCELRNAPCYASKGATRAGIDFFQPVKRSFDKGLLKRQLDHYELDWVRIGCISDPSIDWNTTSEICQVIRNKGKTPVVISKIHKTPADRHLEILRQTHSNLQVSSSAFAAKKEMRDRKRIIKESIDFGIKVSSRINSAALKKETRFAGLQDELIQEARDLEIPILETPLRFFKNSSFWKHLDQGLYHRHKSPISGNLDNQQTAGLIIENAYPCFSSCSKFPTETDPIGCQNQCLTNI